MTTQIPVSVIIPTYNRAALLPSAVQSALGQTLPNVEVIVIDDGSTDNTREVITPYLDQIRYLESGHGGPAHARNIGMKAAKGKYIAFLDSDDRYVPEKLELQVAFLEKFPEVGLVSTEVSAFNDGGILEENHLRAYHGIYRRLNLSYEDIYSVTGVFEWGSSKVGVPYYIGDVFRFVLLGTLIMSNTVLFRREILSTVGYQNERYLYSQEYELLVRICKHYRVAFLDIPTYQIRYHEGQHSGYQALPTNTKEKDEVAERKEMLVSIESEKVSLRAVLDWGIGDPDFFGENREWLNRRAAELCYYIGEMWETVGEPHKARECYRRGGSFDPTWDLNREALRWSYCPGVVRRFVSGFLNMVRGEDRV